MKKYYLSIAVLIGTIVGVGMFTMPYVIMKSGLLLFLIYMPILAFVQYYLHLLYAEVVLATKGDKRLPGYAERYGGKTGKMITLVFTLFSDYGVLLAYIIFGGIFMHQLLSPVFGGTVFMYASALFFAEALIVLCGLEIIAGFEFLLTGFMVFIVGWLVYRGIEFSHFSNLTLVDWKYFFYPYGPIFFSVGGQAAIPEICKLLDGRKEKIRSAIAWGTFLSAGLMSIFALTVVSLTGANTTADGLVGLSQLFSNGILTMSYLFALLAVVTSLITIAQASREMFMWDFKVNKYLAWILACLVPYALYAFGLQNLTQTVSLTGAFSGGMLGVIVIFLVMKIKKKSDRQSIIVNHMSKPIAYIVSGLFILGLVYELWTVFK
jgi:amino acid permease